MSKEDNVDETKENIIDTQNLSKIKIDLSDKSLDEQENSENIDKIKKNDVEKNINLITENNEFSQVNEKNYKNLVNQSYPKNKDDENSKLIYN